MDTKSPFVLLADPCGRRCLHSLLNALLLLLCTVFLSLIPLAEVTAAGWTVAIHAHEIEALSNTDNWGEQDLYWRARLRPVIGTGKQADCDTQDDHPDDANKIKPNWACTTTVSGGLDTTVELTLELYDEDSTSGDDELDLNPDHAQLGLAMRFEPRTSKLTILGYPGWTNGQCAFGRIKASGFGGGGEEPAEMVFSVTASPGNAVDGDTDSDGLLDSWEVCGTDADGDNDVDIDLPAMGADPFRKDLFAEIDWMVDATSASPHSHEPWLPALIRAWNELNVAPVTNPPNNGTLQPGGIALHVDVGTLYANYGFDIEGDGTNELPSGGPVASGNIDLNGDATPDIGNLGLLGRGIQIGGNVLAEDPLLNPPASVTGTPTGADIFAAGSDFRAIKTANFAAGRDPIFHYAVFGHSYPRIQGQPVQPVNTLNRNLNSSGLAEPCGTGPCNEFMVTLGTFGRQTVDANRDAVPDTGPPPPEVIPGPSTLPVDGLINDHAGTFLHELGHNLRLGHGGGDRINYKPNYLSIMNYHWQTRGLSFDFDGDTLGDPLGLDFDGDTVPDVRRYQYSTFSGNPPVAPLNEGLTPPPQIVSETAAPIPWSRALTRFTCPPSVIPEAFPTPPVVNVRRADLVMDWDCAPGATVPVDINNVNFQSGVTEVLNGFDDYNRIANGGLDLDGGISKQTQDQLDATTQRIIEPPHRQEFLNRCTAPRTIDFEDQVAGTRVDTQYGPLISFLADSLRRPTVAAPSDRNNVPTASPDHSLINLPRHNAVAPLVFSFAEPQRVVSLRLGQAGLTNLQTERAFVVLEAFDQNDLPMGRIVKPLPLPQAGITQLVTAAAIFPDELIRRVEVRYEIGYATGRVQVNAPIAEPVQIDDLAFCGKIDDAGVQPSFPAPPVFGDLPVQLVVRSEALLETDGNGEPGNTINIQSPFTGLPVTIDSGPATTDLTLTRFEGTTLEIKAPLTSDGYPFLYWRYGDGVSFGRGVNEIDLTLLRNGVLTAVYEGRRLAGYARDARNEEDRKRAR